MLNALLWNLLLTAGLAIVLSMLCRLPWLGRRPALRHWLWLLLLAKLVTPPLIAVPLLPATRDSVRKAAIASAPVASSAKDVQVFQERSLPKRSLDDSVRTAAIASARVESAAKDVRVSQERTLPNPSLDDMASLSAARQADGAASHTNGTPAEWPLLGGLLAFSLTGTGVLIAVHGLRTARLFRRLRRAATENSLLAESCDQVASRMAIRGTVRSCVVDVRTTPLLCAWRQPLVVMPRRLINDLSPQQLRGIVAHELAHLVRRDHWANLFVFVVKALVWWNPVAWWADRELRAAQELCCDAIAIDRSSTDRRSYAITLLTILDFIQAEPSAPYVLAVGMGSKDMILRRFQMIGEKRLSYKLPRGTFLVLLALAVPLVSIPVRGQHPAAVPATPAAADTGAKATAPDASDKKAGTAKQEPVKAGPVAGGRRWMPRSRKWSKRSEKE